MLCGSLSQLTDVPRLPHTRTLLGLVTSIEYTDETDLTLTQPYSCAPLASSSDANTEPPQTRVAGTEAGAGAGAGAAGFDHFDEVPLTSSTGRPAAASTASASRMTAGSVGSLPSLGSRPSSESGGDGYSDTGDGAIEMGSSGGVGGGGGVRDSQRLQRSLGSGPQSRRSSRSSRDSRGSGPQSITMSDVNLTANRTAQGASFGRVHSISMDSPKLTDDELLKENIRLARTPTGATGRTRTGSTLCRRVVKAMPIRVPEFDPYRTPYTGQHFVSTKDELVEMSEDGDFSFFFNMFHYKETVFDNVWPQMLALLAMTALASTVKYYNPNSFMPDDVRTAPGKITKILSLLLVFRQSEAYTSYRTGKTNMQLIVQGIREVDTELCNVKADSEHNSHLSAADKDTILRLQQRVLRNSNLLFALMRQNLRESRDGFVPGAEREIDGLTGEKENIKDEFRKFWVEDPVEPPIAHLLSKDQHTLLDSATFKDDPGVRVCHLMTEMANDGYHLSNYIKVRGSYHCKSPALHPPSSSTHLSSTHPPPSIHPPTFRNAVPSSSTTTVA